MTSGLPDELDESIVKDNEVHEEYERNIYSPENKSKMKRNIETLGEIIEESSKVVAEGLMGVAVHKLCTGQNTSAKLFTAGAVGTLAVGKIGNIIFDNISRGVDNIPDYHNVSEPISPSAFDLDIRYNSTNNISEDISNELPLDTIESDTDSNNVINTLADNNEISKNIIFPPIDEILEYISGLDDAYKLLFYSLILIIIVIYMQLIKIYKNNINTRINILPINNKYFGFLIQYKNTMNKITNILINFSS